MTGPAYDQALTIAPAALRAPWTRRVRDALLLLLALVALVAMGIDLELAPGALMTGFGKLGRFLGEMFPPSSGGQSVRIFKALAETFAMEPCDLEPPSERQGEAMTFTADGAGYVLVSEGQGQPITYTPLN